MKEKIYFVSYGDKNYNIQLNRIKYQAKKFKLFQKVYIYKHRNLDQKFKNIFNSLLHEKKGGGYWIWKSQVILQTLDKINEGDILLYVDSGSTLNIKGKERLKEYFNILSDSESSFLFFKMPTILEKNWTTKEVFNYFGVLNDQKITETNQYLGGVLFVKKSQFSINFFKNFQKTVNFDNRLITNFYDDNQHQEFMEGRHDQSILSVMAKLENCIVINDESYYFSSDGIQNIEQFEYPILTVRDARYSFWQKIKYYFLYPLNKRKLIFFNQKPYYFKNKKTVLGKVLKFISSKYNK